MAWTTPRTWIGGELLTAALLNTHLRDNFNELDVAKITGYGDYVVSSGANAIVKRAYDFARVNTLETRTLAAYGALATVGPAVTLTTGTTAIVFFRAEIFCNTTDGATKVSYAISGATTSASSNARMIAQDGLPATANESLMCVDFRTDLVAGANTFTMEYAGDGVNISSFTNRLIAVISL